MRQYHFPEAINVDFPYPSMEGSTHGANMMTWLFRDSSLLDTLYFAQRLAKDPDHLSVISAGCSIGAEADSIIALHGEEKGHLTLRGYDANLLAINTARAGQYAVNKVNKDRRGRDKDTVERAHVLRQLGFDTFYEPYDGRIKFYHGETWLKATSRRLREPHDIGFVHHDLRETLPSQKPADIIFANNVFCHVGAQHAERVADNLMGVMSDTGLLSIGSETVFLGKDNKASTWFRRLLESKYDLRPLLLDQWDRPIIYARPESHTKIGLDSEPVRISKPLFIDELEAA